MNTRISSILAYAANGNGRSYGGGLADYDTADILAAHEVAPDLATKTALIREITARLPIVRDPQAWQRVAAEGRRFA